MCSRTCFSATERSRPPVALPVCTTTPSAPISRPAPQRVPQRLHGLLDGRLGVRAEVDQVRARGRTPGSTRPRRPRGTPRPAAGCRRAWPSRAGWRRRPARSRRPGHGRTTGRRSARPPATGTWPPTGLRDGAHSGGAGWGRRCSPVQGVTRRPWTAAARAQRIVMVIVEPLGALSPPSTDWLLHGVAEQAEQAAVLVDLEAGVLQLPSSRRRRSSPVTSGTSIISGPLERVSVTVSPSAAWLSPAGGLLRRPGPASYSELTRSVATFTFRPASSRSAFASARSSPVTSGHVDRAALADDERDRGARVALGARLRVRADHGALGDVVAELPGDHAGRQPVLLQLCSSPWPAACPPGRGPARSPGRPRRSASPSRCPGCGRRAPGRC